MELTKEEQELIRDIRARKEGRLGRYAKAVLNSKDEPTGERVITDTKLDELLTTIEDQKRELSKWAHHECAGTER